MHLGIAPWIMGNFSPSELAVYAAIHITLTAFFLYLAYRVFITQNPFSIFTHTISFLGSTDDNRNPKGWWIFSIGMIVTGLLLLPPFLFIRLKMHAISPVVSIFIALFGIVGSIGLIIIAFLPSNDKHKPNEKFFTGKIHDFVAISSILLLFFSVLTAGITLAYFHAIGSIETDPWLSYGYYFTMGLICIGVPIQLKWVYKCRHNRKLKPFPGDGIYSLPFWEWILFGLMFFIIYWNAFFL